MLVRCEPTTILCSFPLRSYRRTKYSRETSTPACLMRTPVVKNYVLGTVYVLNSGIMYPYLPGAGNAYSWTNGQVKLRYSIVAYV